MLLGPVLAMLLALRLLNPAGFMPAFDRGSVAIIACPDFEPAAVPMPHHHGGSKKLPQHCPYAAGASAATATGFVMLAIAMLVGGRAF